MATSAEAADAARLLLPETGCIAKGADRLYFFYQSHDVQDVVFDDLIEMRSFATMTDAVAWVTRDARERQWLLSCEGVAQ